MPVIQDEVFGIGSDTDFSKSLKVLYDEENEVKKTDLSAKQICKINILWAMAVEYECELLRDMCISFIRLRVSKDRKGRAEAVNMTQQLNMFKRIEALESASKASHK